MSSRDGLLRLHWAASIPLLATDDTRENQRELLTFTVLRSRALLNFYMYICIYLCD